MISLSDVVVMSYSTTNGLRDVGYVPQIIRLTRHESNSPIVSSATWVIFLLANMTTVAYAAVVLRDTFMVVFFSAYTFCCATIVGLTLIHRCRTSHDGNPPGKQ